MSRLEVGLPISSSDVSQQDDRSRGAFPLPGQGVDRELGLDEAGFHVEHAGTEGLSTLDAEGHRRQRAFWPDGVVMAEDKGGLDLRGFEEAGEDVIPALGS